MSSPKALLIYLVLLLRFHKAKRKTLNWKGNIPSITFCVLHFPNSSFPNAGFLSVPSDFIFQVTKSYFNCEKLHLIQLNSEALHWSNISRSRLITDQAKRMTVFPLATKHWETPAKLKMPHLQFMNYYFLSSLAALKSRTRQVLLVLSYRVSFGKRKVSFYSKTEENPDPCSPQN